MTSKWVIGVVTMSLLLCVTAYGPAKQTNSYGNYKSCPNVGGYPSQCRPPKDCAVWYDLVVVTPNTGCKLTDGNPGTCCPDLPSNGNGAPILNVPKRVKVPFSIDTKRIENAIKASQTLSTCLTNTETCLNENKITIRPGSSSAAHSFFSRTTPESMKISRGALAASFAAKELIQSFGTEIESDQVDSTVSQVNLKDTSLANTCPVSPVCDEKTLRSPFRKLDGSCNNVRNPIWGQSKTQYQRLLSPDYAEGISTPRKAKNWQQGRELPSPRLVSISVVHDENSPSDSTASWTMQMGQFLDHDLVSTPTTTATCCTSDGKAMRPAELHPECLPISIPADDPFFSQFGQTCMDFVRSSTAPKLDCRLGYREQLNDNTHFLDLSLVYGSDDKTADELRTKEKGKLKINSPRSDHESALLPPGENPLGRPCSLAREVSGINPPADIKCFAAGDGRSSVTPKMAVSQTVFLREHNRLATELASLNPSWDDERLYQEARRILIAQAQHITYNEWLPIVIGRSKMQQLGLLPLQRGFSSDYDGNVLPSIVNEFVGAAFRFGHSLVQGNYNLFNQQRQKEAGDKILRQHFFKTQEVYKPGNLDKFLISLATVPIQNMDNSFSEELTNHLFEDHPAQRFGLDLVSLNIQRGRDHGLRGYNSYRELCGLKRANNFDDLCDTIPNVIVKRLQTLYNSVDDIDLFIGGVSERAAEGALVGPTFQCIIADQFLKLKRGDRYFYDLGGQAGSFTQEQLDEIRKFSLARLACGNSQVQKFQPLLFRTVSAANPIVDCKSSSIPSMSLLPWKERGYGGGGYSG